MLFLSARYSIQGLAKFRRGILEVGKVLISIFDVLNDRMKELRGRDDICDGVWGGQYVSKVRSMQGCALLRTPANRKKISGYRIRS
jgi:hypothetical protein